MAYDFVPAAVKAAPDRAAPAAWAAPLPTWPPSPA